MFGWSIVTTVEQTELHTKVGILNLAHHGISCGDRELHVLACQCEFCINVLKHCASHTLFGSDKKAR